MLLFQPINSIGVFPLGSWEVHKYVAILKHALSRGTSAQQPSRNVPEGCSSKFSTIAGALLAEGSEELKVYAKIV